jgi:hypothetical protein
MLAPAAKTAAMHIALFSDPRNFHCRKWGAALAATGVQVTVYTLEPAAKPGENFPYTVRSLGPSGNQAGQYRYAHYWFTRQRLRAQLLADGITLLHPLGLTPFGSWARWGNPGLPLVPAAMGADVLQYPPSGIPKPDRQWENADHGLLRQWKSRLLNPWYRSQVRAVAQAAQYLTADNQALRQALIDWFGVQPERVQLLRWGIEPSLYDAISQESAAQTARKLGLLPDRRLILWPRGLLAVYQADLFLEALRLWLPHCPDSHQVVVLGAGYPPGSRLAQLAQHLADTYPHCTYLPQSLSTPTMATLWKLTDISVHIPNYDGYSSALAEARYTGAVLIVNAIAAHQELLTHRQHARYLADTHPKTIAEALGDTLSNLPDWQNRIRSNNRQWILEHGTLQGAVQRFLARAERELVSFSRR